MKTSKLNQKSLQLLEKLPAGSKVEGHILINGTHATVDQQKYLNSIGCELRGFTTSNYPGVIATATIDIDGLDRLLSLDYITRVEFASIK